MIDGLIKGYHSYFPGFYKLFRVPLSVESEWPISEEKEDEIRRVVQNLSSQNNIDIALVLTTLERKLYTKSLSGNF
ncbi:MAG: hypothetical protein Q9N34_06685 [Aquificota bacterium]|nr:hypothetical protein [Aquificota bacterium]